MADTQGSAIQDNSEDNASGNPSASVADSVRDLVVRAKVRHLNTQLKTIKQFDKGEEVWTPYGKGIVIGRSEWCYHCHDVMVDGINLMISDWVIFTEPTDVQPHRLDETDTKLGGPYGL